MRCHLSASRLPPLLDGEGTNTHLLGSSVEYVKHLAQCLTHSRHLEMTAMMMMVVMRMMILY